MRGKAGSQPVSKRVLANGINIHYLDWESPGPPMVMLHPSTGYGHIWDMVARQLHPRYHILAPDQRGHGDTDKPAAGYSGEDFAADLDALAQALGLERFILAGHSLGGRAAQIYGGLHPERVSHIVLVAGPHYVSLFDSPEDRAQREEGLRRFRESPTRFPSEEEALSSLRASRPFWGERALRHTLRYNTNPLPGGGLEWKYDREAVAQTLSHIPDDLTGYVRRIACPVLIARAQHSPDLTPERLGQVEKLYSQVTSVDIPSSERFIELENPEALARAILAFLEPARRGGKLS